MSNMKYIGGSIMRNQDAIQRAFDAAAVIYKDLGVDVHKAMEIASNTAVSMNCWQGDDVVGFDTEALTGGIAVTGNYPGRATTPIELRQDAEVAMALIPGRKNFNLHASYAELNGEKVDRDEYRIEHFQNWVDWAKELEIGLDFNPTFFSHDKTDGDFTIASDKKDVRKFWIEHGKRCREIGAEFGKQLGETCLNNFWLPDGYKDLTADTKAPRERMIESLDEIFAEEISKEYLKDAIESKLFGLGIESYTVASHEFALLYAQTRNILSTLDAGHFHPTEVISAKFSAVLCFLDEILLHVSRPVRWDSDHVILFDDELQNIMKEIVRGDYLDRVHIGLDFFDGSINRISAWTIGTRNAQKALLFALCEPIDLIRKAENDRNFGNRLAFIEETKTLPFNAIWDYYCMTEGVPVGTDWIDKVTKYEKDVLLNR